jgi:aconitate hydratase 2/2-methylisocitrate dehydratase
LKAEGDWEVLQNTLDSNLMIMLKGVARTGYENILYLERPGCNLCMGNQEKSSQRRYGDGNLYASFQGRVVEDSEGKKGESLLHQHQLWYFLPF